MSPYLNEPMSMSNDKAYQSMGCSIRPLLCDYLLAFYMYCYRLSNSFSNSCCNSLSGEQ